MPGGVSPIAQEHRRQLMLYCRGKSRRVIGRDISSSRCVKAKGVCRLDSSQLARIIAEVAIDKKATDVVTLDIRELSVIADYFVICTGANARQIQAIADAIKEKLDMLDTPSRGYEGGASSGWMLLDCGDVIVHIFGPMEREFYSLERLWSGAPAVVYVQ
jgi:ribosome-associated protein